jgi:hypothetical protein
MRLTMSERRAVVRVAAERYRKAGKKQKGLILDELVEVTGYHRCYAVWLLRRHGKTIRGPGRVRLVGDLALKGKRGRRRIYDAVLQPAAADLGDPGFHLRQAPGGDVAGGDSGVGAASRDRTGDDDAGQVAGDQPGHHRSATRA